jgi:serine/threonine protein kinase
MSARSTAHADQLQRNDSGVYAVVRATSAPALSADPAWIQSRIGTLVGSSHRIIRHAASGGMGHVFIVQHTQLGAFAAVKLADPRGASGALARETLAHEAKLLSRVQHPHIVSVFDYGQTEDGVDYLLMEYVSGVDLHAFIESSGPMPLERALPILRQVASAIDHLHAQGIVHSDVKPANVLFDPCAGDFSRLIDFGIAFDEPTRGHARTATGTPAYMAPEQRPGPSTDVGRSVDIYGLAALAFELVTGRLVGAYESRHDALQAALDLIPSLEKRHTLTGLRAVLERALDEAPEARYPSARAFVSALEHALQEKQEKQVKRTTRATRAARATRVTRVTRGSAVCE